MKEKKWIDMWGNATSIANRRPENYGKNLTLRYPVKTVFDGDKIRIRFSNFCGNDDITINKANVAVSLGGNKIDESTVTTLTFDGKKSVTVKAKEDICSDEIAFSVTKGKDLAISFYFADYTELRSAVLITGPLSGGYYSVGDYSQSGELTLSLTRPTNWVYFITDVEVLTDSQNRALVCYGDSITSQSWPDYLSLRAEKENISGGVSIIRKAASGTRILRQYEDITYDSYGLKGSIRFPKEARVKGAKDIIIQQGINDIIHPVGIEVNPFRPWSDMPTANDIIEGLKWYAQKADEYGLNVYFGTLLPILGWRTYEPFREEIRQEVNEFMRNNNVSKGCIDFDKALCDTADNRKFAQGYDSGDHLHPSELAYEVMASIVPKELIK